MSRQSASPRRKQLLAVVALVAVVAVVGLALLLKSGGDDAESPTASGVTGTTATTSPPTTAEATTEQPTDAPSVAPTCEGADTQFNVEGTEQESLLPDCGTAPVTKVEEKKSGLGLGCGGSYPVILYKTTTSDAKTSICGKDASGESFRVVTKPTGGDTVDVKGIYDPQLDAFVGEDGDTSYTVQAYDGTLLVTKDGTTKTQKSSDWISLDNESDYD